MNIIALDTSTSTCLVALHADGNVHFLSKTVPMQQGRWVLPLIQELLTSVSLSLSDINGIAYACGPGSFTGLRIANSVVSAIGFAKNLPILSISSLQARAQAIAIEHPDISHVLVAIDAQMEQIYWANYELNQEGIMQLNGEEQRGHKDAIASQKSNETYSMPSLAKGLLTLAHQKLKRGETVLAQNATPTYLR